MGVQPSPSDFFYFYPLHLEPESVVLYSGRGMYQNQVKLIQNIAAQLPPGDILYVKDHPHDHGYRSADDYIALNSVPNIKILEHNFPGKSVIKKSKGVFTINGTFVLERPFATFSFLCLSFLSFFLR